MSERDKSLSGRKLLAQSDTSKSRLVALIREGGVPVAMSRYVCNWGASSHVLLQVLAGVAGREYR